jgi:hypothetical protein
MLEEIAESNRQALRALDEAEAELQATRSYFADKSGAPTVARRRARKAS